MLRAPGPTQRSALRAGLAVILMFAPAFAQTGAVASFSSEQLEQLVAPIALYPDALVGQVLMAATYPLEIVQAARWAPTAD
jgi:hypothetical protein